MPFSALGPTIVTVKMSSQSDDAVQNVFVIKRTGGPTDEPAVRAAIIEWIESIYTELLGVISEEASFNAVNIYHTVGDESTGDHPFATLTAGGATGDQLPPGVALLASFLTGIGRRVGRKYFGPLSEAAQDNGIWTAGTLTALVDAALMAALPFTASNGVSMVPVIYDRLNGVMRDIVEVAVHGIAAYQRRRRQGRGV